MIEPDFTSTFSAKRYSDYLQMWMDIRALPEQHGKPQVRAVEQGEETLLVVTVRYGEPTRPNLFEASIRTADMPAKALAKLSTVTFNQARRQEKLSQRLENENFNRNEYESPDPEWLQGWGATGRSPFS